MEEEEVTGEYLENKIKSLLSVIHLCVLIYQVWLKTFAIKWNKLILAPAL